MVTKITGTYGAHILHTDAMDEIVKTVSAYLPPDSGIEPKEVVTEIIRIIETRTGHKFLEINAPH